MSKESKELVFQRICKRLIDTGKKYSASLNISGIQIQNLRRYYHRSLNGLLTQRCKSTNTIEAIDERKPLCPTSGNENFTASMQISMDISLAIKQKHHIINSEYPTYG